jgi:hypothetical protein
VRIAELVAERLAVQSGTSADASVPRLAPGFPRRPFVVYLRVSAANAIR